MVNIETLSTQENVEIATGDEELAFQDVAEKSKKDTVSCFGPNCYWISCAIGSGLIIGTGSYIIDSRFARYGFIGTGVNGPGTFVIFFTWRLILEIKHRVS